MSDALAWGRRIRLFTVVDVFTREALAIEVDTSLPGLRVVQVLDRVVTERGTPAELVLDNGPERRARSSTSGLTSVASGCASSSRASRSRMRSSRASTAGCVMSASTSTGSSAWPTPGGPSRPGDATTIRRGRTAHWATAPQRNFAAASTRLRVRGQSWPDSHNPWTKQGGQVSGAEFVGFDERRPLGASDHERPKVPAVAGRLLENLSRRCRENTQPQRGGPNRHQLHLFE